MISLSGRSNGCFGTGDSVVDGNETFLPWRERCITATASRTQTGLRRSSPRPRHTVSGRLNALIGSQNPPGDRDLKAGVGYL